jgi:hypothetical protein
MSVTITNLIQGPGTLYTAAYGATEPADADVASTPSASTWTDVGGTDDGVTLKVDQTYAELKVDQIIDVPGRRKTKQELTFATNLAEPTMTNLELVLNGGTVSASSGYSTYEPADDSSATQPTYKALLFDGFSPEHLRRRVVARRVLSIEGVEAAYKKENQTLFPVTFAAHYVSSAIKPWRVIDETS